MILKLIQSKSYSCGDITVSEKEPVITVNDKERADYLLSTGYFDEIAESKKEDADLPVKPAENQNIEDTASEKENDISKMKVSEIEEMAVNLGIDISEKKTKAEKVAAVVEFLDNKAE